MNTRQLIHLANIWVNPRNRTKLMRSQPFRDMMASTSAALHYGVWLGTPSHHVHRRRIMRHGIAHILINELRSKRRAT